MVLTLALASQHNCWYGHHCWHWHHSISIFAGTSIIASTVTWHHCSHLHHGVITSICFMGLSPASAPQHCCQLWHHYVYHAFSAWVSQHCCYHLCWLGITVDILKYSVCQPYLLPLPLHANETTALTVNQCQHLCWPSATVKSPYIHLGDSWNPATSIWEVSPMPHLREGTHKPLPKIFLRLGVHTPLTRSIGPHTRAGQTFRVRRFGTQYSNTHFKANASLYCI